MDREHLEGLKRLEALGWALRLEPSPAPLPETISQRYSWVPYSIQQFISEVDLAVSPDEKAWLLGSPDFRGSSHAAYVWNEWEKQSLQAASGQTDWTAAITSFWDQHMPIAMSVKSGYAYFAMRKKDSSIVCGEEPEFEETTVIAASLSEFLRLLANPEGIINRFV
jgi:hypothetical protein